MKTMKTAYRYIFEDIFEVLNPRVELSASSHLEIELPELKNLSWKSKPFTEEVLEKVLPSQKGLSRDGFKIRIDLQQPSSSLKQFVTACRHAVDLICAENLNSVELWATPTDPTPGGFSEAEATHSKGLLESLYKDDFIVREKKAFIIDLKHSKDAYMVSTKPERHSVVDGGAQIASLSLGFNHPTKLCMAFRSELLNPDFDVENWDVTEGFRNLLKKESGLPFVYFVNSGAEGNEVALKSCQTRYPDRKKLIAFEGSFHGRSLLTLHATYNPSKRLPFETYKDIAGFVPFPEDKTPSKPKSEPKEWLPVWGQPEDSDFMMWIDDLRQEATTHKDVLLEQEIESLLKVREMILQETPLAVLIEPMLCEGGDRYGSSRFFRALRILTRALDTALIFDEVQTGIGLGGPFFWFHKFNLVDLSGNRDLPDAVSIAKKSQVGVCITRYELKGEQKVETETSAASLLRGYLQSVAVTEYDWALLDSRVETYLHALQKIIGEDIVSNPRNAAMAFAFDLPTADIVNKLVAERFKNGTVFYPAGDVTARFRLMASTTPRELAQIFIAVYRCFEALAKAGTIRAVPPIQKWVDELSNELKHDVENALAEKPGLRESLPWDSKWIVRNKQQYLSLSSENWNDVFCCLSTQFPQLLRSPLTMQMSLAELNALTADQLWKRYETDDGFTLLDLLWTSSRALGFKVERLNAAQAKKIIPKVSALEEKIYEKERQDDPVQFADLTASDSKTIYLAVQGDGEDLAGFCFATPMKHFDDIALVNSDPFLKDSSALYAADLSIDPEYQSMGLGARLKCEQIMEAVKQGASVIRSRNRWPEAKTMTRLNRKFSAVIATENPNDYGGKGLAFYQSLQISAGKEMDAMGVASSYLPAIKNKTSLGNFVSTSYVRNLLFIKEILPEHLRHLYLSSGRSEAVDKAFKLFRFKREKAKFALSFKGDFFGSTTACARSLGGVAGQRYFDWPLLSPTDDVKQFAVELDKVVKNPEDVFCFFVEPICEKTGKKRSKEFLKGLIDVCHKRGIPVVFHETASAFYQYDSKSFFAADNADLQPDGLVAYGGQQVGIVAINSQYYLEKALMMISTWDGDEHSLNLFRDKILQFIKE